MRKNHVLNKSCVYVVVFILLDERCDLCVRCAKDLRGELVVYWGCLLDIDHTCNKTTMATAELLTETDTSQYICSTGIKLVLL